MKSSALAAMAALLFFFSAPSPAAGERYLTLGAYTAPREAFRAIIPLFVAHWRESTGETIRVRESYLGSGAQSRAIVDGFEADVAALATAPDVARLVSAGLIREEWPADTDGFFSSSLVVIGVRKENPVKVRDWHDLARPGIRIVMANPKSSGGAQWTILALYGAVLRGAVPGYTADEAGAQRFLKDFLRNLWVLEKGAREAIITFEKGIGNVLVTYENEMRLGRRLGQSYEIVYPAATIRTDLPIAVVDRYAEKHGVLDLARAFVEFLKSKRAQEILAENGFRPFGSIGATSNDGPIEIFSIDTFGGWPAAGPRFFGPTGIYATTFEVAMGDR